MAILMITQSKHTTFRGGLLQFSLGMHFISVLLSGLVGKLFGTLLRVSLVSIG